jgi:hypothetical protein
MPTIGDDVYFKIGSTVRFGRILAISGNTAVIETSGKRCKSLSAVSLSIVHKHTNHG